MHAEVVSYFMLKSSYAMYHKCRGKQQDLKVTDTNPERLSRTVLGTVKRRTSINVFVKLSTCAGIIERDASRYRFSVIVNPGHSD